MAKQRSFESKFWNLAQASAWVEFREKQLVQDFYDADRDAYMAVNMYPTMWPGDRKQHGSIAELRRALEEARLDSWGFRAGALDHLQKIPAVEWADFVIRPPLVAFTGQLDNLPWQNVRVLSADMKKLWRDTGEVGLRTKFDWPAIKAIYDEIVDRQPGMSANKIIEELQLEFEARFNKEPPSRSAIQNRIKTWL